MFRNRHTESHEVSGTGTMDEVHARVTNHNTIDGYLVNPFRNMDPEEMDERIVKFMANTGLSKTDERLIRRGAILAQLPEAFTLPEMKEQLALSSEDYVILCEEDPATGTRWSKWKQKPILYALVACCSIGAAVQGWDETAINQGMFMIFQAA